MFLDQFLLDKKASSMEANLINYENYPQFREYLYNRIYNAVQNTFPVENEKYRVELTDLAYTDPAVYTKKQEKDAVLHRKTLSRKLTGKYNVYDKATGQLLSNTGRKTVMNVPYLTDRGTFIRNGVEYTSSKQLRLIPNIYSRKTASGQYEAQFNIKPRTGVPFRIEMDPSTSLFYMKSGGRKLPLYPILKYAGVQDDRIKEEWGDEIYKTNRDNRVPPHLAGWVRQAAEKGLLGTSVIAKPSYMQNVLKEQQLPIEPADISVDETDKTAAESMSPEQIQKGLNLYFNRMELDPAGTLRTLNREYPNVTDDAILNATGKVLRIARGQDTDDNRDSMEFQTAHDIGDFISEKIQNDQNGLIRNALWKLTGKGGDASSIPTALLDKHLSNFFNLSGVTQVVEEISPIDLYNQNQRVIRLGEGAMPSVESAPKSARNVQFTYPGYIGLIRSPESLRVGLDLFFARGVRKGKDNLLYNQFLNPKTGKKEWVDHRTASSSVIGMPEGLSTEDRFVPAVVKGRGMYYVPREEVNYFIQSGDDLFSRGANTVPLKSGVKGMRLLMGCLHPDTDVWIKRRNRTFITSMRNYKWKKGDCIQVLEWNNRCDWNEIRGVKCNKEPLKGYVIETDSGRKAVVTYNHVFSVRTSKDSENILLSAENLKENMYIPYASHLEPETETENIQIGYNEYIELDFNAGYFFGMYMGNENAVTFENSVIELPVQDMQSVERIKEFLVRNRCSFDYVPDINKAFLIYNKNLALYMCNNLGSKASWRKCPDEFISSTDEFRSGILAGYFASSGFIYKNSLSNSHIRNSIQLICSTLGIKTSMYYRKYREKRHFGLKIHPSSFASFVQKYVDITHHGILYNLKQLLFKLFSKTVDEKGTVRYERIKRISEFTEIQDTYDIDVDNRCYMLANGMFVHNSKFVGHALPLVKREAPYVQSTHEDGTGEMDYFGKYLGAVKADKPGIVQSVSDKYIRVKYDDGTEDAIELYNVFPFQRKTYITNYPSVSKGDVFKKGDTLAGSNFTDDKGTAAPGKNLRVAYIGYQGKNYEDAVVISESAAKNLTAETMYNISAEEDEGVYINKNKYRVLFPGIYTKEQLQKIDNNGIVIPGTKVEYGDPLVLSVKEKTPSLSMMGRRVTTDESQKWEHHTPGVVTDVAETKDGYRIFIRSNMPVSEGDKLCYDDKTEVLTEAGWKLFKNVDLDDKMASLNPEDNTLHYIHPESVRRYLHNDRMYRIKSQQLDLKVTPNHNMYIKRRNRDKFEFKPAEEIFGKRISYKKDADWRGVQNVKEEYLGRFCPEAFFSFLGAFLSEGYTIEHKKSCTNAVAICQYKEGSMKKFTDMLDKYNVRYSIHKDGNTVFMYGKPLLKYFKQFGKSYEKYIPEEVFRVPKKYARMVFEWMMWGDGYTQKGKPITYYTSSRRLADDFQRLLLHIGYAGNVQKRKMEIGDCRYIGTQKVITQHHQYEVRVITTKLTPTVNHSHVKEQNIQIERYEDYAGYVYCCTLPEYHTLYVRRNGKAVWSGNSIPYGSKGVVSQVVKDDDMPKDSQGRPFDMLLSPLGIISRCYSQDTEFLTDRGWVFGKDIKDSDKFAVYNPENENVSFEKGLSEFYSSEYTGDMYRYVTQNISFCVTPNHPFKVKYNLEDKGYEEIEAKDLKDINVYTSCAGNMYTEDMSEYLKNGNCIYVEDTEERDNLQKRFVCNGYTCVQNGKYLNVQKGMYAELLKDNWEVISYKDYIYCPSVSTGYVVTRYKGKVLCGSNTNPSQLIAASLGKVAEKTGKPYILPGFSDMDLVQFAKDELKKNGLTDREDIYDPVLNKTIPNVFAGNIYTYRLQQTAESKGKSRSTGSYSQDEDPSRGGVGGCFPGNEYIYTDRGLMTVEDIYKSTEDIKFFGCDVYTGETGFYPVTDKFVREVYDTDLLAITVRYIDTDGNTHLSYLNPTVNHNIYTPEGKKVAGDLKEGDTVLYIFEGECVSAQIQNIMSVADIKYTVEEMFYEKYKEYPVKVYDFTVQDVHTYTVGNVVVSNSKHLGDMEYQSLLAHGASNIIKDMKLIKGQKNQEFWRQLKLGETPLMPKTPFVYDKFRALIKASGVNLKETNRGDSIFAMTNEDVMNLTGNRKVQNSKTYDAQTLRAIKNGLFDPELTGSDTTGDRWSYIEAPEPMLNPVMEAPVKAVLGLTQKELDAIVRGDVEFEGEKGGNALKKMLEKTDLKQVSNTAMHDIYSGSKTRRDNAVKRYGYAQAMLKHKVKPQDFMLDRIPVLPPRFRPITKQGDLILTNDPNYMYKAMMESIEDYKDSKELPEEMQKDSRAKMYNTFKALIGTTDPSQPELQQKQIGGILQQLLGKGSPKSSWFFRKVLGSNMDVSGSAVIAPDPTLKLNQVGLPENYAWELYEPFIIRELVRRGVPAVTAAKEVSSKTKGAYAALQTVVKQRPVLVNRAPTLHKYSIMAFWPKLVKGDVLKISPSIVGPYGADFDGDSCWISTRIRVEPKKIKESIENSIDNDCNVSKKLYNRVYNFKGDIVMTTEDTKLMTRDAVVSIENMPVIETSCIEKREGVKEWDVPEGVSVYAYDTSTGEHSFKPVTKFSVHENLKMFDVSIGKRYKKVVSVSEDHSLITYNPETGAVEKSKPEESIGRLVPIVTETSSSYEDSVKFISITDPITGKSFNLPASYKSGFLIGSILGDGWVDTDNRLYFTSAYKPYNEYMVELIKELCPKADKGPVIYTADRTNLNGEVTECVKIRCNTDPCFNRGLKSLIGSGAENKTIPWECLNAPKAHLYGLLAGLISTDGSISAKHRFKTKKATKKTWITTVGFDTISPYLRDTISYLSKRLGIRTTCTPYKSSLKGTDAYRINFSKTDFVNSVNKASEFQVYPDHKSEALEVVLRETNLDGSAGATSENVPYPVFLHDFMCSLNGRTAGLIVSATDPCNHKRNKYMSRQAAYKFIDEYRKQKLQDNDFDKWIKIVEDDKINWQPIIAIKELDGVHTAYDITVPGPYTFATADGVILQDTGHFSVPVSDAAVKDAVEKMMPEKNLLSGGSFKPHYTPSQEYIMGMYYASKEPKNKAVRQFGSVEEAKKAYRDGEINVDDPIVIR